MRPTVLALCLPALLAAQSAPLDEGRIDPDWFGPGVSLRPSKALDFQWLRPGLTLQGRSLLPPAWEPAVWLLGKRSPKDRNFLGQVETDLPARLEKGLRRGLKGRFPAVAGGAELRLVARVVDAEGLGDDYMAMGTLALSFDVKLLDGATGEPQGAFHGNLRGPSVEVILLQFEAWCEHLGALLASVGPGEPPPLKAPPAITPPAATPPAPVPGARTFDLERALRHLEDLKRDGLLTEEEYQRLRKRAADRAR